MFEIIIGDKQRCPRRIPPIPELIGKIAIQNQVYSARANSSIGHVWNQNEVKWEMRWFEEIIKLSSNE